MSAETPERIAEIRARREALSEHATNGDWHYGGDDAVQVFPAAGGTSELVATIWGEADEERVLGEFIAHSKDDVDWLLAEVERLHTELDTIRAEERARCVAELDTYSDELMAAAADQVIAGDDKGFAAVRFASSMARASQLLESGELSSAAAQGEANAAGGAL